jgi:hypothetical protein
MNETPDLLVTLITLESASSLGQQVAMTFIYRNVSTQNFLRHNYVHFDKHLTAVIKALGPIDEGLQFKLQKLSVDMWGSEVVEFGRES